LNVPAQLPERSVRRRRPITAKGRREFLACLAAGWSVQAGADRAGWHRSRFYAFRDADGAFAAEWDDAVEAGCDVLEDALRIAASEGWDEETYDGEDVLIRRTRRRDPRLNRDLLERRRPTERAAAGPVTLIIATAFPGARPSGDVISLEAHEVRELPQEAASVEAGPPPEDVMRTLHIGDHDGTHPSVHDEGKSP
jgi:hypothetical protein